MGSRKDEETATICALVALFLTTVVWECGNETGSLPKAKKPVQML
jgi:hypothetical protein